MLIPTVVMAVVVGIGVGINTQPRQRDKRQRHKKCQTSCAYSQTDCSHFHTPGPHRTRGVLPSHWVKCPVGRTRRTSMPDSRLGRMYQGSGYRTLQQRHANSTNEDASSARITLPPLIARAS